MGRVFDGFSWTCRVLRYLLFTSHLSLPLLLKIRIALHWERRPAASISQEGKFQLFFESLSASAMLFAVGELVVKEKS